MKLEQIDTSTTAGKAEVMQLAAEGRRVAQALLISRKGCASMVARWEETSFPEWDWADYLYAIIAEPAGLDAVWVVFKGSIICMGPFGDEQLAIDRAHDAGDACTLVKYVRADLAGEVGA